MARMQRLDVRGRTTVITGAASGMGAEVALELARRGARLALVDRNADGLQATLARLTGTGHTAHVVDLTDYLCPDGTCSPVIGNIVVYLDHDHITATYARTLALLLREQLADVSALGEILPPVMAGDDG